MVAVILLLFQTATELGLICSITVLALYLSYEMLGICDLSTEGCFTLGACVGAVVAISGHPYLSLVVALVAGAISGFITAFLQTKMGVQTLLAGIIMNSALYSINIAVMKGASNLNMNKTVTVFTQAKDLLEKIKVGNLYKIIVAAVFVALVLVFLNSFLKTRLGLAIRATGDNISMVKSSSINPDFTTIVGLCISGAMTALSGCLLAQSQKSVSIDTGSGILTVALASLLLGFVFIRRGSSFKKSLGCVLGAIIFRVAYSLALKLNMPAYMLKLVSATIVVIAVAGPYLKSNIPLIKHRRALKGGKNNA